MKILRFLFIAATLLPLAGAVSSCSEQDDEEEEYANWQVRNDAVTAEWAVDDDYLRIKSYAKEATTTGKSSDYIYYMVLDESDYGDKSTPLFTDTVRVSYRGRLIPSKTYIDGYVFDQTYLTDDYSPLTAGTADFVVGSTVVGFATALQHMHRGDRWLVGIPYDLGYGSGTGSSSSIPAYSNLIFDVVLLDFWHPGEKMPSYKSREMKLRETKSE